MYVCVVLNRCVTPAVATPDQPGLGSHSAGDNKISRRLEMFASQLTDAYAVGVSPLMNHHTPNCILSFIRKPPLPPPLPIT